MKKVYIFGLVASIVMSSCSSMNGVMTGGSLGSVLGSAIGGLAGGARGSDVGTIVGMAGGAVAGAVLESNAQKRAQQEVHDRYERVQQNSVQGINPYHTEGTRSTEGDGVYGYSTATNVAVADTMAQLQKATTPMLVAETPNVELVNVRFVDDSGDGQLSRGETGKIMFEIFNRGGQPLYNLEPSVVDLSHNKYITVSPSILINNIEPQNGMRYTAVVAADKKVKKGRVPFAITVLQNGKSVCKVVNIEVSVVK